MATMLEVRQLTKQFNGVAAVKGISFEVGEGTCLGLLGPNGAGKTTTVEMMEGLKQPDHGQVLYRGKRLDDEFKSRAGIMFQSTALQDFITVEESLNLFAQLYPQRLDLDKLVEDCALGEFLHQETSSLSGGQRQRLLLAIALVNDPDVLFLDEPTTGLDPQSRHNFWRLVQSIKQQNKTIVLTTHYMEEAYELCDNIIIMDHGQIIAEGTPKALLSKHFDDVVIHLPGNEELVDRLQPYVEGQELSIELRGNSLEIFTADITLAMGQLVAANIPLDGIQVRERTLEDLFLELTGKGLRQ